MLPTCDVHFAHGHIRVSSVNCEYGTNLQELICRKLQPTIS